MASNFKILAHRNCTDLHIELTGDFDGSSAWQLLNMLKKRSKDVYKIFVHTSNLKDIHSFGKDTFQNNLCDLNGGKIRLYFIGKNAGEVAGEKYCCH